MNLFANISLALGLLYSLTVLFFFIGLLKKRRGKNREQYRVSVIIAARNEEDNIGDILFDLTHQTYPTELYEVIVANDGSSDKTADIVQHYASQYPNIKLLYIERYPSQFSPKKYALQQAVQHAAGDIILTTDADCRVGSRWIESMISYFEPEIGFVIGFSQFGQRGQKQNFLEKLQAFDFLQLMGATAGTCNLGYPLAASGQNLGYRRTAFQQVGGYRRVAERISGDDVLLLQLIRRYTDWKTVFASSRNAFAMSQPQSTLRGLINQRKRWASNGSYQVHLNVPFFAYLLLVFLFSFALFVGMPLSFWLKTTAGTFSLCLLAKAAAEALIAFRSAQYFHRQDLLKYFPIWFLLQIPYVVIVGLWGTFGSFSWKERNHTSNSNKIITTITSYLDRRK